MERVVVGGLLVVGSVIGAGWSWRAFLARHVAVGLRDRVLTRGALGGGLVCLAAGELGLFLAIEGATGAGADRLVPRVVRVVVAVAIAAVVYGVIAWREWRRGQGGGHPVASASPTVPAPDPATPDWVPPSPQAVALLAARGSDDTGATCRALALEPLAWLVRADDDGEAPTPRGRTREGGLELLAWTDGSAPAPTPEQALDLRTVIWLTHWEAQWLFVDPGLPTETRISRAAVLRWIERRGAPEPPRVGDYRIRTHSPVDPADPVTFALALTAVNAVMTSQPWNRLGPRGHDRAGTRRSLRESWGLGDARDWQRTLDAIAEPFYSGGDLVFRLRREIGGGALVPAAAVVDVVEDNVEHNGRDAADAVLAQLRRIEAYEGYLRDHGVLAADEQVHSLLAWDVARGAMLARWGLDADWCDEPTARWQLERFGTLAHRYFDSWSEFGASFVLGRLLWSDDRYDEYGDTAAMDVEHSVQPLRVVLTHPASPWRTVPFLPATRVAAVDDAEA